MTKRRLLLLPLVFFLIVSAFLLRGLSLDPHTLPSTLIGRPAPALTAARLYHPQQPFEMTSMRGKTWLLNVFASWCQSCLDELPVLLSLKDSGLPIVGLDYKDKPTDAKRWLSQYGSPYSDVISDVSGEVAINYGVYGTPELFLIGPNGLVLNKYVGRLTPEIWAREFMPLIKGKS